uniref:Uncharacterized protein n=1 Tax=Anopheles epiroticus TaxID=199890 RepID=A0A182P2S7_9DIPT
MEAHCSPLALLLVVIVAAAAPTNVAGFPRNGFEEFRCLRSSPTLNKCIEGAIQHYINYLYSGTISERTTVSSLDPLVLPDTTLIEGDDVVSTFTHRQTTGFRSMYITDVRSDISRLEFYFKFHISAIDTRGSYHARLQARPEIAEWSQMTYSIRNSSIQLQLKGFNYEHDDRVYLKVNVTDWSQQIGDHTVGFRWFTMSGNYSQFSDRFEQIRGRDILPVVERDLMHSLQDRFQRLLNEILRTIYKVFYSTKNIGGVGDGGGRDGCRRSGPELPECIGASVQQFVNFMSSGKLSVQHTITPFDPLHLPNMTFSQEQQVKATYWNRYLVGLKNTFIQDVRVNIDKLEFNVTAIIPALEMLGMFSKEASQDRQVTENSIVTFSIRNMVVGLTGKGTLYSATNPAGTASKYLRLQLTAPHITIGSNVPDSDAQGGFIAPFTATKLKRLIEKDLRMQLAKRIQHIANEALALTPFVQLFPV